MPLPALLMPLLSAGIPAISSIFGGGAGGAAKERDQKNAFATNQNQAANQQYGTAQSAALQALLAKGNEATSRYGTKQGATSGAMAGLQNATSRALEAGSNEGLERARLGMAAPSIAAKQSVLGSMMKNMQPTSFQSAPRQSGHETKLTGGLSAATLDPQTRAQGDLLLKSAMEQQLKGGDIPGPTDFKSGIQDWKSSILDTPEATDYSKGLLAPPKLQGYQNAGKGESMMSGLGMGMGILGQLLPALSGLGGGGGGGGDRAFANLMPSPYAGGTGPTSATNFQIPQAQFPNADFMAQFRQPGLGDDTFIDE